MKNIKTLGKLIGLLLFCLPLLLLLSINMHTKNTRNELSRLVMGTIFLVYSTIMMLSPPAQVAVVIRDHARGPR